MSGLADPAEFPMSPTRKKSPPKRRNLAARALRDPLFRPKALPNPNAYRRRSKFNKKPDESVDDDQIN